MSSQSVRYDEKNGVVYFPDDDMKSAIALPCPSPLIDGAARQAVIEIDPAYLGQSLRDVLDSMPDMEFGAPEVMTLDEAGRGKLAGMHSLGAEPTLGALLDASSRGFSPLAGESVMGLQEDELGTHNAVTEACCNAFDNMCGTEGAVYAVEVRTVGSGAEPTYALVAGDDAAEQIDNLAGFHKDGVDWGEHNGSLALRAHDLGCTQLTFHELTGEAADMFRDEAGTIDAAEVSSDAVRDAYFDPASIVPPSVTLCDVQLCVDDLMDELEHGESAESLDEMMSAKCSEAEIDEGAGRGNDTEIGR